jgi:predicted nucleic acid-binding protein
MNCTIDASVFVAAARSVELYHIPSRNFLQKIQFSQVYCPTLALAECAAAIARPTGDSSLAEELVAIVEDFPGINLVSLDLQLAHRAAQIAVSYRLRGADAVYVAVAEAFNATLFSWDLEMLRRCPATVDILTPTQWLKGESL